MENTNLQSTLLDFEKEKVQVLTLDQLSRTYKENDVYGKPLRGIYHSDLIRQVSDMAQNKGYNVDIYDLFAAQNRDKIAPGVVLLPQVEERYGKNAVEAHILRRVYANIRLTDMDDETYTTNIAIAFHQRGIQAGFGNMVKICHNQCMLGADSYISTYSDRGRGRTETATVPEILARIELWLTDARPRVMAEREKIERMKSINMPAELMYQMIGLLTTLRVAADTKEREIRTAATYPLNQSQITLLTEALMLKYARDKRVTVWDFYDAATELYKADQMEIPNLMTQNRAMCNFIDKYLLA